LYHDDDDDEDDEDDDNVIVFLFHRRQLLCRFIACAERHGNEKRERRRKGRKIAKHKFPFTINEYDMGKEALSSAVTAAALPSFEEPFVSVC